MNQSLVASNPAGTALSESDPAVAVDQQIDSHSGAAMVPVFPVGGYNLFKIYMVNQLDHPQVWF